MPYVRVGIFLTCGKHLHDSITSVRGEVSAHKTSLTLPLVMEVTVPSQDSERSCILCVRSIDLASFSDFYIWFWNCADSVVSFCISFYCTNKVYIFKQCKYIVYRCSHEINLHVNRNELSYDKKLHVIYIRILWPTAQRALKKTNTSTFW